MSSNPLRRHARWSGWTCCLLICVAAWLPLAVSGRQDQQPSNPYGGQTTVSNTPALPSTPAPAVGPSIPGSGVLGNPLLGTSALGGFGAPATAAIPDSPGLLHYGPLNFYPEFRYLFTYGNSLQATPGARSDTALNEISPGFLTTWKTNWSLLFTPSLFYYSNPAFHNVTDYAVSLNGGTVYRDWNLKLIQGYSQTDTPLVETAAQTDLTAYITSLDAIYQMGTHFSLELGVTQSFRDAQSLSDLHEWSTADWLNYQVDRTLGAGLGVVLGYDQLSSSSDMPFEQVQGRINFASGQKLSFTVSGGVEDRQFVDPTAPNLVSPIFSAQAIYQLFDPSTITLQARRTVTPSLFANQLNTSTSATLGWRQRLLKDFYFDVTGSYTSEPYTSIEPGKLPPFFFGVPPTSTLEVVRVDTATSASFSLSYTFRQHLTANVFYTVNRVDSSQSSFALSTSQVGFALDYTY